MSEFLDTSVIIRYVTRDDPDKAERARKLLDELRQGERVVTTCEAVLMEAVYVLSSAKTYQQSRDSVRGYLAALLDLPGLQIPYKRTCLRALDIYVSTRLKFVDALNVAHMERSGIKTIISYDKHFDKIPGVERREP